VPLVLTVVGGAFISWLSGWPCVSWAAAQETPNRYHEVRHLLVGEWYPLTPYPWEYEGWQNTAEEMWNWSDSMRLAPRPRSHPSWLGSQYHRSDLDEGMILIFRRPASSCRSWEVRLKGLSAEATYLVKSDRTGETRRAKGAELMNRFIVELPEPRQSDLITYRREGAH
jgi:hypothetical protein